MSEWRTWKIVGAKAAETIGSADSPDISTAATQTRSLPERLGPTQTVAKRHRSEGESVAGGKAADHCLAFLLALGRGVRNEATAQCSTLLQSNSEQCGQRRSEVAPYRGALALDSLPGGYRGAAVGGRQARSQCQSDPARSAGGGNLPALRQRLGREWTIAHPLSSNVQWTSPPSAMSWAPGRAGSRVTPDGRPMLPPTRPERGNGRKCLPRSKLHII